MVTYAGMRLASELFLPDIRRISPLNKIDNIPENVPIVILAGGADRRARPVEAQALHARVAQHCQLIIINQADHLQLRESSPREYESAVLNFLSTTIKR